MTDIQFRKADKEDASALNDALRKLSHHMGDEHPISEETLSELLFGETKGAEALLAEQGKEFVGIVMFSPFVSTTTGGLGIYVSDLWVDASIRGQGLGPRLLAAAVDHYSVPVKRIRLAVYHDNQDAFKTYLRLGFKAEKHAEYLALDESDFKNIRKTD